MRALPQRDVAAAITTVRASKRGCGREAGVRVPGLDGGAGGRGAWGTMDRDGHRGPSVDHPGHAHEGEPGAPGSVVPPRRGDPRRVADARRWPLPARVHGRRRRTARREGASPATGAAAGPPYHMASARRSGTGRRRRRSTGARSSRRRWLMWSATRSKRPTRGRTCSSAAAAHGRVGRVFCRHTPSAASDRRTSGTRGRQKCSTLTTTDSDLPPRVDHTGTAHWSVAEESTEGHQAGYGDRASERQRRSGGPREDPGGEDQTVGRKIGGHES